MNTSTATTAAPTVRTLALYLDLVRAAYDDAHHPTLARWARSLRRLRSAEVVIRAHARRAPNCDDNRAAARALTLGHLVDLGLTFAEASAQLDAGCAAASPAGAVQALRVIRAFPLVAATARDEAINGGDAVDALCGVRAFVDDFFSRRSA